MFLNINPNCIGTDEKADHKTINGNERETTD